MKKYKRVLSLLTVLSMVAIMFSVVPMQVSAVGSGSPGDIFTNVRYTGTEWQNNLQNVDGTYNSKVLNSKISLTSSSATYTVAAGTNSGTSWSNRYFLVYNNGKGDYMYLATNTRYRVSFTISAQGTAYTLDKYAAQLTYMEYNNNGAFPKLSTDTAITDLSPYAVQTAWAANDEGYNKYRVTLTYDTPASTSYNLLLALSVFFKASQTKPIYIQDITWEHLCKYNVVNADTSANIGTLWGMPGDDVETLLTAQGFGVSGYTMTSDTVTAGANNSTINVTYTLIPVYDVQEIDFSDSYAGGSPNWRYIPSSADSFELDGTGTRHIELTDEKIHHDRNKNKPTGSGIGQHSVTLANNYTSSDLEAGGTYRVTFELTTFPHWTPVESLGAYIRFGQDIWTNVISTIELTGEDLAAAIISNSPTGTGSVVFTISLDVTLPESGWANSYRNIILAVYGGEYWLDNVAISTTARFDVQDESSNHLGYAYGLLGDRTAKIVDGDSLVDAYHTYSLSPATVTSYSDVITLTKSLKSNIVEKVSFGSDTYGGYTNTNSKYYETKTGATVTRDGSNMKFISNSGNSFGNRSVVIANDRTSALLTPGEQYALRLEIATWDNNFANLSAEIRFGNDCWSSSEAVTFTNAQIRDSITGYGSGHQGMTGYVKKHLFLLLKFTVPTSLAGNENLVLSLYGANGVDVDTRLYTGATIYSASQINISSHDGAFSATVTGFEGDTITEAFDSTNNVKFTDFSETFGVGSKDVKAGVYIERGDANGDHKVDGSDISTLVDYILGEDAGVDTFGANANANTFEDAVIDVKDLVHLKDRVVNPPATGEPMAGLNKSGYKLAWSYEFSDNTVDTNYFGTQYGMAHNSSSEDARDSYEYVGMGDKKSSYVKNGMLVISPDGVYGSGKPYICDPYMTKDKMHFTYGYLEINAKIPFNSGSFPALWLKSEADGSGNTWEIDLVETLGSTNNIAVNLHYWENGSTDHSANGVSGRNYNLGATINEFHKFGFEWYKSGGVSYIAFYVDGNLVKTLSKNNIGYDADFDQEMYLMLENFPITSEFLSANTSWLSNANAVTASDYPMDMCIDYVRLYQTTNNSGNTLNLNP